MRSDVKQFVLEIRETTTDLRTFASSNFAILASLDKDAGGHLPTAVVQKLIKTFKLVGPRGGPSRPGVFRTVWEDVKIEKQKAAAIREARKAGKSNWRSALADPIADADQTIAARHAISHAPARSRGPPASGAAPAVDIDAVISELFAPHRARLPPMPTPFVTSKTESPP